MRAAQGEGIRKDRMKNVYVTQIVCANGHCLMAEAADTTYEDAQKNTGGIWDSFYDLIDDHVLKHECAICKSTDLHTRIDLSRFRTIGEAASAFAEATLPQAAPGAWLKSEREW